MTIPQDYHFESQAIRLKDGQLYLLDQTQLPLKTQWLTITHLHNMVDAIKMLKVRGAPLIAVAASFFVGIFASTAETREEIVEVIHTLIDARPTAVNLSLLLEQHLALIIDLAPIEAHFSLAVQHAQEDITLCNQIAAHGLKVIRPYKNLLTHCNTGSLATAGVGTALGIIKRAYQENKNVRVYVDETRPLLQGARLTAWELSEASIPYELICDNMAASLMQKGKIDAVIVGADRIALNGDFANKIGTYTLAIVARYHEIPFYVAAPYTTIDRQCLNGMSIPIELRNEAEVKGCTTLNPPVTWSPAHASAYNPAFDVTPGELVTAFILDNGVVLPDALGNEEFIQL